MLRELKIQKFKPVRCDLKAASELNTGMGVVLDLANGKVALPSEASAENIYVVDKERYAEGFDCARTVFSDYFADFNVVAAGVPVKVKPYNRGERIAVDAFVDAGAFVAGTTYLQVGTDGKWIAAESATPYMFGGKYNDAGHELIIIDVVA